MWYVTLIGCPVLVCTGLFLETFVTSNCVTFAFKKSPTSNVAKIFSKRMLNNAPRLREFSGKSHCTSHSYLQRRINWGHNLLIEFGVGLEVICGYEFQSVNMEMLCTVFACMTWPDSTVCHKATRLAMSFIKEVCADSLTCCTRGTLMQCHGLPESVLRLFPPLPPPYTM